MQNREEMPKRLEKGRKEGKAKEMVKESPSQREAERVQQLVSKECKTRRHGSRNPNG